MNELLFISILEKNELMTEESIKDYFKKDVTLRALKKGYPEKTKFKLGLKEVEKDGQLFVICFVFDKNTDEESISKITTEELLKLGVFNLYEEIEKLENIE